MSFTVERMVWPWRITKNEDGMSGLVYEDTTDTECRPMRHFVGAWGRGRPPRRIQITADPSNPLPLAGTVYDPRRYRRP